MGVHKERDTHMDYRTEAALDRLVELSDDPSKDELTVLREWRNERLAKRREHEASIRRLAEDNPTKYGLMRIEQGVQQQAGTFGVVLYPTEYVMVNEEDVYSFAKEHGLRLNELWEVLRGERLQVKNWRAYDGRGSSSKLYIDRTEERATRAALAEEDRQLEKSMRVRNEQMKQAVKPMEAVPTYKQYIKG